MPLAENVINKSLINKAKLELKDTNKKKVKSRIKKARKKKFRSSEDEQVEPTKRLRRSTSKRKLSSAVLDALRDSEFDTDDEFRDLADSCDSLFVQQSTKKKSKTEVEKFSTPRLNKSKYYNQPRPYSKSFSNASKSGEFSVFHLKILYMEASEPK